MKLLSIFAFALTLFVGTRVCAVPNGGDVDFYAGSYHHRRLVGGLVLDGVTHDFTSTTTSIPSGAQCVQCSSRSVRFWQKVTVSGVTNGPHTVTTTCRSATECPYCRQPTLNLTGVSSDPCDPDETAPTVTCPSASVIVPVDDQCAATVPNCAGLVLTCDACDTSVDVSQVPNVGASLSLGATNVLMTASDNAGNTATCNTVLNVVDATEPVMTNLVADPATLWPPNHNMVDVSLSLSVDDNCDNSPVCRVVNAFANEPDNESGDGNTNNDALVTGAMSVQLRAERAGNGNGREYTVAVQCTDSSGNVNVDTVLVSVQQGNSGSGSGSESGGEGGRRLRQSN